MPTRPTSHTSPPHGTAQVVVMGVSGSGKSHVGHGLAERLGWDFVEGDDLHPEANVAKMAAGEPLTDEDRAPWLDEVSRQASTQQQAGRSSVLTCSALKRSYRDRLRAGVPTMLFVHLHGAYDVLEDRMQHRDRHFMPTSLLRSQFDTLEPLDDDEDGVVVDVAGTVEEVTAAAEAAVRDWLRG